MRCSSSRSRVSVIVGIFGLVGLASACFAPKDAEEHGDGTVAAGADVTKKGADTTLDPEVVSALEQFPDAEVLAARRGVPTFVRGSFGTVAAPVESESDAPVRDTLTRVAPVFKLRAENLRLVNTKTDALNATHARYQQMKNGLPVVGGDLILHLDDAGALYAVSGGARDGVELTATPKIADAFAESIAAEQLGNASAERARLVYFQPADGAMVLAWEVKTRHDTDLTQAELIYVDAQTGSVVERQSLVHSALSRSVHSIDKQVASTKNLPGKLVRSEGSQESSDSIANVNYDVLGDVHSCYRRLLGRDSYDAKGGKLVSTVHVFFSDGKGGSSPNNAMWSGDLKQMMYGEGDNKQFANLAVAFDVTAHEIGHGITGAEAALVYKNESGALNEAMSDIFAAACEYDKTKSFDLAWKIGETVLTPGTEGDALRYMNDPTKDKSSKDYYPERYLGDQDNGGVHLNSGIANLAFVLLSTGGKHPRAKTTTSVPSIGIQKATAIFYRALSEYMTSSSNFMDARATTAHAARDLYGADAENAVNLAWDAVGVPRPATTTPNNGGTKSDAGAPTPKPGTGTPAPTTKYGCCLNGRCYDCPDKAAADKCAGFDLNACISKCADTSCFFECSAKARTATHDPSSCTAR